MNVGHLEMEETEFIIADLRSLNKHPDTGLDAMLGAPFLMQRKMAINYKKKNCTSGKQPERHWPENRSPLKKKGL